MRRLAIDLPPCASAARRSALQMWRAMAAHMEQVRKDSGLFKLPDSSGFDPSLGCLNFIVTHGRAVVIDI
jgi:hypothetical protein